MTVISSVGCILSLSLEGISRGSQSSEAGVEVELCKGIGKVVKPAVVEVLSAPSSRRILGALEGEGGLDLLSSIAIDSRVQIVS